MSLLVRITSIGHVLAAGINGDGEQVVIKSCQLSGFQDFKIPEFNLPLPCLVAYLRFSYANKSLAIGVHGQVGNHLVVTFSGG